MKNRRPDLRSQEGQTTVEYILLLSVVVMLFSFAASGLRKAGVTKILMRPLQEEFARTYQYGHPKAKGHDDGGPENHPRAEEPGDNNFRIFIMHGKS